jgi:hypothetical protein
LLGLADFEQAPCLAEDDERAVEEFAGLVPAQRPRERARSLRSPVSSTAIRAVRKNDLASRGSPRLTSQPDHHLLLIVT